MSLQVLASKDNLSSRLIHEWRNTMEIVQKPQAEKEILASASKEVKGETILEDIKEKDDHCVNHLCGCN